MSDDATERLRKKAQTEATVFALRDENATLRTQLSRATTMLKNAVAESLRDKEKFSAAEEREAEHQKTFERHAEIIGKQDRQIVAAEAQCAAMVGALKLIRERPYDEADSIAAEVLSNLPARSVAMGKVDPCEDNSGRAIIEDGAIVIRLPIANLPQVVEGAWAGGNLRPRLKVTDAQVFAKELCRALNDEEEDGTTRIHLMFDASIEFASEQGFEGIEEHEEQES